MPHIFPFANGNGTTSREDQELGDDTIASGSKPQRMNSVLSRLQSFQRFSNWLKREDELAASLNVTDKTGHGGGLQQLNGASNNGDVPRRPSILGRRLSRRVIPELPRPQTFHRQLSERRERLTPVEPTAYERRAVSEDRRSGGSSRLLSPPPRMPSASVPDFTTPKEAPGLRSGVGRSSGEDAGNAPFREVEQLPPIQPPPLATCDPCTDLEDESISPEERELLERELDSKWILNLSMHFRDKSEREKFFITYAQDPNRWRRVTVSCDYRKAQPDSLEADLKPLHYQRDKSLRIYDAIRDSLPDIQFYDSVTNLKLETDDGRLHVHVTEDINEIIPYPDASVVRHIHCQRYRENDIHIESHLSGFVYRVGTFQGLDGPEETLIKKEIPGPDTVDEFLYEVNALDSLQDAHSVINLRGLVTDDSGKLIKGLLISYASRGALVDYLFNRKGPEQISWARREKWARQIVQGLSEIHEAGFVQGDFTLSNIVLDDKDDAKIIDINRRGCPVGWEPPELGRLIENKQKISMCIGVKTDIFQLGMVLWALAEHEDEPERVERPLPPLGDHIPLWYSQLVQSCLSEKPQGRMSAQRMLARFPPQDTCHLQATQEDVDAVDTSEHSFSTHRSDKEYIDPAAAVALSDIDEYRRGRTYSGNSQLTSGQDTAPHPPSTSGYHYSSSGSYLAPRGRRHLVEGPRATSPYARQLSSNTSLSSISNGARQWETQCTEAPTDYGEEQGNYEHERSGMALHEPLVRKTSTELMPPPSMSSTASLRRNEMTPMSQNTAIQQGLPAHHEHLISDPRMTWHNRVLFGPPQHQDSGFDEQMMESLAFFDLGPRQGGQVTDTSQHSFSQGSDKENASRSYDEALG